MVAPHPDDLLPEPAVLTGALVGYARVSTRGQLLDRQLHALTEAGCLRVFAEKETGRTAERPELAACLDYLRPGDTLVVPSLDRLSRSLQDLITMVADLRRRGVGFRSLHEALDTTTPGGRLIFHVFAALAEFIRELIVEGTREGLEAAKARGVRLGRPPAMTPEQVGHAVQLLTRPENSVASIARLLGVSRSTLYANVPELRGGRGALTTAPAVEASPARPPADYVPYGERRPYPVADSLAELTGPTADVPSLAERLAQLPPDGRPLPSVAHYDQLLTHRSEGL
jgi:DNA invertase Pin-like site-specific DNA recombinase